MTVCQFETHITEPRTWLNLPEPDPALAPGLLEWFERHGRHFVWREELSPFHLLCAEVMLQRTRAKQVEPVLMEFRSRYATPNDVIDAGRDAVGSIFARLGLAWRGEQFWRLQEELVRRHAGGVPRDDASLRALPGVGDYVSAAVRVFAFGERLTVLDSNVLRILGRYFGIEFPDHARRSRRVQNWANSLAPTDPVQIKRYNWALIDLGAMVCTPQAPSHAICPITSGCRYAGASCE